MKNPYIQICNKVTALEKQKEKIQNNIAKEQQEVSQIDVELKEWKDLKNRWEKLQNVTNSKLKGNVSGE